MCAHNELKLEGASPARPHIPTKGVVFSGPIYTVEYITRPEWDYGCGCCIVWDATIRIIDDGGRVFHEGKYINPCLEDFDQVMEVLRRTSVGRQYGEYMPSLKNEYYDEEKEKAL